MILPFLQLFSWRIEYPLSRRLYIHYLNAFSRRHLVSHALSTHDHPTGIWPRRNPPTGDPQ